MGNGVGKLTHCCSGGIAPIRRRRHVSAAVTADPYDENLGHSFCYVRPNLPPCAAPCAAAVASAKVHHHAEEATTFCSISGASISANAATPLSTSLQYNELTWPQAASAFESSDSFAAVPLQPVPRFSGPLSGSLADSRGFLSGPIERGFMSGPLDPRAGLFSAPLDRAPIGRSLSLRPRPRGAASSLFRRLSSALSRTKKSDSSDRSAVCTEPTSGRLSVEGAVDDSDSLDPASGHNVQWAQGKAGEDRVHVVVSDEHGWVFVGIYDGFNGPDATDFLLSNLYSAVQRELEGHLWEDKFQSQREPPSADAANTHDSDASISTTWIGENGRRCTEESKKGRRFRGVAKKWEENQRRWKCEWDRERLELDRRLKEQSNWTNSGSTIDHLEVLKALSKALRKTEETYLDIADKMVPENPELALMGSCVLVMLMKGDDVYLMNVGDSRAVLAHKAELDVWASIGKETQDLERIKEETFHDLEAYDCGDGMHGVPNLAALQMTLDHSTCVEEVKD